MLPSSRPRRKPLRLIRVPLPEIHPDWLELDRQLDNDHLARRIRSLVEQIDLSLLFDSFAGVGSAITPPDLLLQFILFEIWRKRLSPACWFLDARESLPARWLLRGLRPARCVLYRFRQHLPPELVDTLNKQILRFAQEEGHTTASKAALDGTFHAAAGSRHRLLNAKTLEQRCEQLDAVLARAPDAGPVEPTPTSASAPTTAAPQPSPPAVAASCGAACDSVVTSAATAPTTAAAEATPPAVAGTCGAEGDPVVTSAATASDPRQPPQPTVVNLAAAADAAEGAGSPPAALPGWMAGSKAGQQRQRRRYEKARQTLRARLEEHAKRQKRKSKAKRRSAEQIKICPSEPEAALGKDKLKVFRPLYNTQIVQDIDSPFVLGYGVYASVTDAGLLPPMLERTVELTGHKLDEVLSDGIYARLLDARYCQEEGIQLYAPVKAASLPERDKSKDNATDKEKAIGKEQFAWLAAEHTYRCPQGHLLQLERCCAEERRDGEQVMVEQYRCAAEHCQACPLAQRCTRRPDKGRTVKRMHGQELLDEVGERMATTEGKQRYKKRSQTVELRHADFRAHRGLERFHGYGLQHGQSLIGLMVLAHNGLALLNAREATKEKNKSR
jgi:DDE family transposase